MNALNKSPERGSIYSEHLPPLSSSVISSSSSCTLLSGALARYLGPPELVRGAAFQSAPEKLLLRGNCSPGFRPFLFNFFTSCPIRVECDPLMSLSVESRSDRGGIKFGELRFFLAPESVPIRRVKCCAAAAASAPEVSSTAH